MESFWWGKEKKNLEGNSRAKNETDEKRWEEIFGSGWGGFTEKKGKSGEVERHLLQHIVSCRSLHAKLVLTSIFSISLLPIKFSPEINTTEHENWFILGAFRRSLEIQLFIVFPFFSLYFGWDFIIIYWSAPSIDVERQRLRLVGDKPEEKEPWMDFSFCLENNWPEMKFLKFTFIWFPLQQNGVIENDVIFHSSCIFYVF